ncbi:MAG: dTDP-4-dehydrorhamnose 3,5-epimerase [Bacteroidales bacterium]|jgi:dTDP-4-dehydrorhamnose 3,5-epimerase|nr:dTDP-4-dehydrorhamnose 3,5-epimerase [Bacteroidales bacterium]MDD2687174.1 dTDP-4-dehydrorhamnose 3,5-epimerase [Bacteroidales bacterium]MDD3330391.1 dTDP-4-dehydrorhamnose 3,5-epimerase [Bacteroidales bacterium]MDD3690911.1 dTDP-4-dehydrorhamnose 3,5-epimerase [Bacteroidales bacterium]MDD4044396.1 dTDP-4-dehydrorhamnose 3,5-epimerase [Bacteroidales bacterium]
MEIIKTEIPNVLLIQPQIFTDKRGCFFESFNKNKLALQGLNYDFVQDNQSVSNKGVIRGLHFQAPPFAQGKLVRVVSGLALDVAVDIRKNSPTYGKYVMLTLSANQNNMLWIPEGFAHGFAALEDNTVFLYKTTNYYHKDSENTILWNDADIRIPWGIKNPIVSDKDAIGISFKDFISPFI